MSYQPFPPAGTSQAGPVASPRRRSPLVASIGVVVLVAGIVVGGLLVLMSTTSVESNAKKLARSPSGCTTSLQFDKTGTFLVYFEHKGHVAGLDGTCPTSNTSYERAGADVAKQTVSLTDSKGNDVELSDAGGKSYDAGGFQGELISTVRIDSPGVYRLSITPSDPTDTDYVLAIGNDPKSDQSTLLIAGITSIVGGLIIGGLLMLLGLRRRALPEAAVLVAPTWQTPPTLVQPQTAMPSQPYGDTTVVRQPPGYTPRPGYTPPPGYTPSPSYGPGSYSQPPDPSQGVPVDPDLRPHPPASPFSPPSPPDDDNRWQNP